jgi:hypothetical protein
MTYFYIKTYSISFKGFKYLRIRKAPILSDSDKLARLNWCLTYQACDFDDYIFADETAKWVFEIPLYQHRLPGERPEAIQGSSSKKLKVNICGGITKRGPTDFAVN